MIVNNIMVNAFEKKMFKSHLSKEKTTTKYMWIETKHLQKQRNQENLINNRNRKQKMCNININIKYYTMSI